MHPSRVPGTLPSGRRTPTARGPCECALALMEALLLGDVQRHCRCQDTVALEATTRAGLRAVSARTHWSWRRRSQRSALPLEAGAPAAHARQGACRAAMTCTCNAVDETGLLIRGHLDVECRLDLDGLTVAGFVRSRSAAGPGKLAHFVRHFGRNQHRMWALACTAPVAKRENIHDTQAE